MKWLRRWDSRNPLPPKYLYLSVNRPPSPPSNLYQQSKRKLRLRSKRKRNPNPNPEMKSKSQKQVAFLLSKVSPLSKPQQSKLQKELHSGAVKVKKGK